MTPRKLPPAQKAIAVLALVAIMRQFVDQTDPSTILFGQILFAVSSASVLAFAALNLYTTNLSQEEASEMQETIKKAGTKIPIIGFIFYKFAIVQPMFISSVLAVIKLGETQVFQRVVLGWAPLPEAKPDQPAEAETPAAEKKTQ
eukprot:NODE_2572_length_544_cov_1.733813_g2522_i0.p1 GENE.NODE_2572_length_544_cov_1.733813_g2522_i0~~NODE_2572_length_544_cov_1.733813_g2522_i0.p1  ORF type:complete len:145 (+),score=33.27 NODE_2572_length_544_cov_1.733813_g2522_i0:47-481(+)